jgi:hypothetical protein
MMLSRRQPGGAGIALARDAVDGTDGNDEARGCWAAARSACASARAAYMVAFVGEDGASEARGVVCAFGA